MKTRLNDHLNKYQIYKNHLALGEVEAFLMQIKNNCWLFIEHLLIERIHLTSTERSYIQFVQITISL